MGYRKFTADNIFTGYEFLGSGQVLVTDEHGKVAGIVKEEEAGDDVEAFSGIISPGFINCHCHLELSHMKGLVPRNTGMVRFLLTVMGNRTDSSERILEQIATAEKAMIDSGIVAVGDICNTDHTVVQKRIGNLYYHNFIEATGFVGATAGLRFAQALDLYGKFSAAASIVPHAPYSVSPNLFELIDQHEEKGLLSIHNQESRSENEFFENGSGDFLELYKTIGVDISDFEKTGTTSIKSYLNKISGAHSMILVHNTVTSEADIDWILHNESLLPRLYWCLCPNANLYINNMLADLPMLLEAGCKMVVGTDSLASNDQLNIISELNTLHDHFPFLKISQLLQWATANGAEALRISERYGSFEKGRTPGVVLVGNTPKGTLANASLRRIL